MLMQKERSAARRTENKMDTVIKNENMTTIGMAISMLRFVDQARRPIFYITFTPNKCDA